MRRIQTKNSLALRTSLVFIMLIALCFNSVMAYDYEEEGSDPQVTNADSKTAGNKPDFTLEKNEIGSVVSGWDNTIKIPIRNNSEYVAQKVYAELLPAAEDAKIFTKNNFLDKKDIVVNGETAEFKMTCTVNSAAKQKMYPMKLKLSYKNRWGDAFSKEFPVNLYVENHRLEPVVDIIKTEFERSFVDSYSPQKMKLTLKNAGGIKAQNISIQLNGFDKKSVYLFEDVNTKRINNLSKGDNTELEFIVIASEELHKDKDKNKEDKSIEATIKYKDELDQEYTRKQTIFIPTKKGSQESKVSNLDLSFSKENYVINGDSRIEAKLTLKNNGKTSFKNLKLLVTSESGVTIMSKYIDYIDELKAGEVKEYTYKLSATDSSINGNFPITAKVGENEDGSDSEIAVAGVTCYKKDDEDDEKNGNVPKIIIADYSYGGEKIIAGKPFDLNIVIKNTSENSAVKNIKITYESEDSIFIPTKSANSFFIDYIAAGGSVSKTINITSKPDAAAKMYKITFSGEYEDGEGKSYDEKGNLYKSEEAVVLNLSQQVRLETSEDLNFPEICSVGEPINLDLEFYNMGKAQLYNLMVKLEGNFEADTKNYFVGNFEAAKTDMFSSKITPTEAGELKGKIIFEFEDELGNKSQVIKEIASTVEEMNPGSVGDMGMDNIDGMENIDGMGNPDDMQFDENGNPIQKKSGIMSFLPIIIPLLIVGAIVFLVIRKKRKKKALEKMLLEDEDENK